MFAKLNQKHLIIALVVLIVIFIIWVNNKEKMTNMVPDDTLFRQVSGYNEFKNDIKFDTDNQVDTSQVPPPYRQVPMESNTIHINGMNKYLWKKQPKI